MFKKRLFPRLFQRILTEITNSTQAQDNDKQCHLYPKVRNFSRGVRSEFAISIKVGERGVNMYIALNYFFSHVI